MTPATAFKKGHRDSNGKFIKGSDLGFKKGNTWGALTKGKVLSEETKEKIRQARKGKCLGNKNGFKSGQIPWNKGKPWPKELKEEWSGKSKGICFNTGKTHFKQGNVPKAPFKKGNVAWNKGKRIPEMSGENHPCWLGGISFEPYGVKFNRELKGRIRKRDKHTCQECGFTENKLGYKLPIHHIDYNKKNNKEENLIALCKGCHGQTNFSREDWTNYFQGKGAFA